ncbi:hypothetical protein D5125_09900 [Magnetovirga frankeli]|uniref:hypothetical protein n=1 Tax=Magnetovirga frankeli TaxID=947516 RepID=UPI00129341F7|nr:hypothetical protein D5125_09900 [gamma proteobacterium SS-5]
MASALKANLFRLLALPLLLGLAWAVVAGQGAPSGAGVPGTSKAEQAGATCVRPTEEMRRYHMDLIQHERDRTVREGIRVTDGSLAGCVDCHSRQDANQQPVAIDAEGEFCQGCHGFTAVNITCFQCHSSVPATVSASR